MVESSISCCSTAQDLRCRWLLMAILNLYILPNAHRTPFHMLFISYNLCFLKSVISLYLHVYRHNSFNFYHHREWRISAIFDEIRDIIVRCISSTSRIFHYYFGFLLRLHSTHNRNSVIYQVNVYIYSSATPPSNYIIPAIAIQVQLCSNFTILVICKTEHIWVCLMMHDKG